MGATGLNRYEGVVFQMDAVLAKALDANGPALMPRIVEAFNYLKNENYHLVLTTHDAAKAEIELKHNSHLHEAFTRNGIAQIVEARQREPIITPHDTKSYFDGLKKLGIETPKRFFAIASSVEGIKAARATGISNVIGYYGGTDIEFGTALAHKGALERKGHVLAGATQTMGNYAELPELLFYLPSPKAGLF